MNIRHKNFSLLDWKKVVPQDGWKFLHAKISILLYNQNCTEVRIFSSDLQLQHTEMIRKKIDGIKELGTTLKLTLKKS